MRTAAAARHQTNGCQLAKITAITKNDTTWNVDGIRFIGLPSVIAARYQPAQPASVNPMLDNVPASAHPTTAPPGAKMVIMLTPPPNAQLQGCACSQDDCDLADLLQDHHCS